jgi:hypothetical protein
MEIKNSRTKISRENGTETEVKEALAKKNGISYGPSRQSVFLSTLFSRLQEKISYSIIQYVVISVTLDLPTRGVSQGKSPVVREDMGRGREIERWEFLIFLPRAWVGAAGIAIYLAS